MKKNAINFKFILIFLLLISFLFNKKLISQTVYSDKLDGTLVVTLKNEYETSKIFNRSKISNREDVFKDYVYKYFESFKIKNVSKPYSNLGLKVLERTFKIEFEDFQNIDLLKSELEKNDFIDLVEYYPIAFVDAFTPNDAQYNSYQWDLKKINAPNAWDLSKGDTNIVIAIIDDAIRITHEDIKNKIWTNYDEIPNNNIDDDNDGYIDNVHGWDLDSDDGDCNPPAGTPDAQFYHGTYTSGIAGGETNNSKGIASLGYNTRIMPVKCGRDSDYALAYTPDGIAYAIAAGANIINMSFGYGSTYYSWINNIIQSGYNKGIMFVGSAGNETSSAAHYPSSFANVISVAATTSTDAKLSISNYGTDVDICAPGSSIRGLKHTGDNLYKTSSGTSCSAPIVSALIALMYDVNPNITQQEIYECLTTTAVNIDAQNASYIGKLGAGRIDAELAISCAIDKIVPPIADFTSDKDSIVHEDSISFEDLSTQFPETWEWEFEGGTPSISNEQNPIVYYMNEGIYDVKLIVTSATGLSDTMLVEDYVKVVKTCPKSYFNSNKQIADIGEYIYFNDTSTNLPSQWKWYFEGAHLDSSFIKNPIVSFDSVGIYDVKLITYKNGCSPDTLFVNDYINIEVFCPDADFNANATSVFQGQTINFVNNTINNTDSVLWVFQGGIPNISKEENPTVTYDSIGVFGVKLIAYRENCANDTLNIIDYITVESANNIDVLNENKISVYCSENNLYIKNYDKNIIVLIYNDLGQLCVNKDINPSTSNKINLNNYLNKDGVYIVNIKNEELNKFEKIIIQH